MRKKLVTAVAITLLGVRSVQAAHPSKVRALNIGAQAVVTLASGLIQGKIHSGFDAWKCLATGSAAGYGFYEAKIRVARGRVLGDRGGEVGEQPAGLNVAASVSENAAAGRNPVSQVRIHDWTGAHPRPDSSARS